MQQTLTVRLAKLFMNLKDLKKKKTFKFIESSYFLKLNKYSEIPLLRPPKN